MKLSSEWGKGRVLTRRVAQVDEAPKGYNPTPPRQPSVKFVSIFVRGKLFEKNN